MPAMLTRPELLTSDDRRYDLDEDFLDEAYLDEVSPLVRMKCERCNGTGTIGVFAHVAGGECFVCHGARTVLRRAEVRSELAADAFWQSM